MREKEKGDLTTNETQANSKKKNGRSVTAYIFPQPSSTAATQDQQPPCEMAPQPQGCQLLTACEQLHTG